MKRWSVKKNLRVLSHNQKIWRVSVSPLPKEEPITGIEQNLHHSGESSRTLRARLVKLRAKLTSGGSEVFLWLHPNAQQVPDVMLRTLLEKAGFRSGINQAIFISCVIPRLRRRSTPSSGS